MVEKWRIRKIWSVYGGEIAAEYLTQYLKPEIKTVYVRGKHQQLLVAFKMKKDPNGEIELLKNFWDIKHDWQDRKIVHPILIYADLLLATIQEILKLRI